MKSFVKFLFMAASAMTVMLFPSCDKDDDGGSAGGFDVHDGIYGFTVYNLRLK